MGVPAVFSLMYLPDHYIVKGDGAATAQRIAEEIVAYRWIVLGDMISAIFFLLLAWNLYQLFEDVDRKQARLLVTFVIASATLGLLDVVVLLVPLTIQESTLAAFRFRNLLLGVSESLWGLWLLPFGVLVIKSRVIPKFIGVFLIVGCFAWLVLSAKSIVFPRAHIVESWVFPLTAPGELSMVLWLLFKSVWGPVASRNSVPSLA